MRKVEVVPHDSSWRETFDAEASAVARALGDTVQEVHHIGSTAIPGIYAKPVIDLLVEVKSFADVDNHNEPMNRLGYEAMGEYGIPGRRYFRKDSTAGVRTHHVHVFKQGSAEGVRHLAFRDYMKAHPDEAQAYSELKQRLARAHPDDIESYMDGKDAFIKEVDRKAARWRTEKGDAPQ